MGTPDLLDIGKHCSVFECKQIDFLPVTCNGCNKVFCLEHQSYVNHNCGQGRDVTVVICPLSAKGVRIIPDEDPNITWERHVNTTDCDPSNYDKAAEKKKQCPVLGCREVLTFSNTIKCRDCMANHCLRHRFGTEHKCPGPKKPDTTGFSSFMGLLSRGRTTEAPKGNRASSDWGSGFLSAASSFKATASAGVAKLSNNLNQKLEIIKEGVGLSSSGGSRNGQCPHCGVLVIHHSCRTCTKN